MKRTILLLITFLCFRFSYSMDYVYHINDICIISVTDKLELRRQDDIYTHFLNDTLKYHSAADVVFQQQGLSERSKEAQKYYCRILIKTDDDGQGNYPACNSDEFSSEDIQILKESAYQELAPGQKLIFEPLASVETTSKGYNYIKISYTRTGAFNNGNVCVCICYFFNYNQTVKFIYSYRQSEEGLWLNNLENVVESFDWDKPFYIDSQSAYNYQQSQASPLDAYMFYLGLICGCIIMVLLLLWYFITHKRMKKIRQK